MLKIPLAWKNFVHNKGRMLASVGGVGFAVVLMFIEMGFSNGLYDSETQVIKLLNADLIIVHEFKEAVVPKVPFPKLRIIQARRVPGVQATYPLYVEEYQALWKRTKAQGGNAHPILVFAQNPDDPVFLIPDVARQQSKLKEKDTALVDTRSREFYGDLTPGTRAELSSKEITIVGNFTLGPDFRADGYIIVSDLTFFKCFPNAKAGGTEASRVEFGLVAVTPGYDVEKVQADLQKALPNDVRVLTKQELADRVKHFWASSKPVGYVFGLGTFVGFLIGVTICYQILFTDIVDHLPQYATLKAIGYPNSYLVKLVLQQAIYLGIIGFFPGLVCSLGIYALLQGSTGILMQLTPGRVVMVFVLTVAMCALSGLIAIRKVISSDPAEVF
jgi:putative ABC transport system permease protein